MSCDLYNMLAMWSPLNIVFWKPGVELHVHNMRRSFARIISSRDNCAILYDKTHKTDHAVTLVLTVTVHITGQIQCVIR